MVPASSTASLLELTRFAQLTALDLDIPKSSLRTTQNVVASL